MKFLIAAFVACFVALTNPVAAQEPPGSLVGTWIMTDVVGRSWNGTKMSTDTLKSFELEITEQDGPIYAGKMRWQFADDRHQLTDGAQTTSQSEGEVLVVRDFDGTYIMVDHPDTTINRLQLVDADTLEMVGYESGPNALVGFTTFKRK